MTIDKIDEELEQIYQQQSKLFEKERELEDKRDKILRKDILDSKSFDGYIWTVKNRDGSGFILSPTFKDDKRLDVIQTKLKLYPHGNFRLADNIEIIGSDGDLYIIAYDIKDGIEFIKSQNIQIIIDKGIIDNIALMEKELAELKEFIREFDIN